MKKVFLLSALLVVVGSFAQAKDCTLAVYKTYMPNNPGKEICDEKGFPAEFGANSGTLLAGLSQQFGYKAAEYDQCEKGFKGPQAYTLVSQLGNCTQFGITMTCQLWVALFNEQTNKKLFENTITTTGIGGATGYIGQAVEGMPSCAQAK
jgi:hypothetical protein